MENLLFKIEQALLDKSFKNGLDAYTQPNCSVTLTNNGLRIYRTPNVNPSNNGSTMWGGMKLQPYNQENKHVLIKGHTYIVKWHVKGKTSGAATSIGWTNQMGWGGGGLNPNPSNISYRYPGSNFQGEMECFYKFTINDDVMKTCTYSYSGFVAGNSYLSYKDFMMGWEYTDTGSMGTDLYVTNIRMYDITSGTNNLYNINKNGIIKSTCIFDEGLNQNKIYSDGEIISNNLFEY